MSQPTATAHAHAAPHLAEEIATQPQNWAEARDLAKRYASVLPRPGERVALVGCGSSLYVARAIARLREAAGLGLTDAWPGGDPVLDRDYDRIIGISRSGTTTEVLQALDGRKQHTPVTVITADTDSPIAELGGVVSLADMDERSVVQSRLVTSTVAIFRWLFGEDLSGAIADAEAVLAEPESAYDEVRGAEQITFVGQGWAFAMAEECSLKLKESTQSWTESFQMTEYRHGPISIAAPGRAVWTVGPLIPDFARDVAVTGATLVDHDRDPLAEVVAAQRFCLLRASDRGLDPDQPRNLARSIILDQ